MEFSIICDEPLFVLLVNQFGDGLHTFHILNYSLIFSKQIVNIAMRYYPNKIKYSPFVYNINKQIIKYVKSFLYIYYYGNSNLYLNNYF